MLAPPRATVKRFARDQSYSQNVEGASRIGRQSRQSDFGDSIKESRLGFVRLLARANEVFDGYRSFDALPLFEFTYPIRNGVHHIASGFARSFAASSNAARLAVPALSAFHNFYFFLRHTFSGKQIPLN
jgi:hypothetical protein